MRQGKYTKIGGMLLHLFSTARKQIAMILILMGSSCTLSWIELSKCQSASTASRHSAVERVLEAAFAYSRPDNFDKRKRHSQSEIIIGIAFIPTTRHADRTNCCSI